MPFFRLLLPSLRQLRFGDWLVIAAGTLLLLGLSGWQWQRLGQKQALLQEIATGFNAPPADAAAAGALKLYRGYDLTLALDRANCFPLQNQANQAGQLGRRCVCWADFPAAAGSVALAFPWDKTDICTATTAEAPADTPTSPPLSSKNTAIPTAVQAFALPAPSISRFMPANPVQGDWWWMDLAAMPKRLGKDGTSFRSQLYLQVASFDPDQQKWLVDKNLDLPNNHLQYALTWLLLALGWVVMMVKARLAAAVHRQSTKPQTP
jgi:cytochrome oxidase assembly protein ShyY1